MLRGYRVQPNPDNRPRKMTLEEAMRRRREQGTWRGPASGRGHGMRGAPPYKPYGGWQRGSTQQRA
jgi:hypothetical protein